MTQINCSVSGAFDARSAIDAYTLESAAIQWRESALWKLLTPACDAVEDCMYSLCGRCSVHGEANQRCPTIVENLPRAAHKAIWIAEVETADGHTLSRRRRNSLNGQ